MEGDIRRRLLCGLFALLLVLPSGVRGHVESSLPAHPFAAYHESWAEPPVIEPGSTRLARLPSNLDLVMLAFAKPDAFYNGDFDLRRTGLGFPFDGRVVRNAVAALRHRNPHIRVLLSVGGATYRNWAKLNSTAIALLVSDLGLDGVDVDFEPSYPACMATVSGTIRCASDLRFITAVTELRRAVPRPRMLSVAVWSVGAFGEGLWRDAQPTSRYTGMSLALLRSPAARAIDLLGIMAYDAGPRLDPIQAFEAYRSLFHGPLLLGVAVQDNSEPRPDRPRRAEELARGVRAREGVNGIMLYNLQMTSPEDAPGRPLAATLAGAICRGLGRTNCAVTLP